MFHSPPLAPFLAAADWIEVVAALVFFLITGVAQFLQNKSRRRRGLPPLSEGEVLGEPPPQAPPASEPAPAPMEDWERQLRRLLEGQAAPPVLAPAPPQTAPPAPQPSSPLRRTETQPRDESFSWESEEHPHRPLADFPGTEVTTRTGERLETKTSERLSRASSFEVANRAMDHAADLHDAVADRMRAARDRTDPRCAEPAAPASLASATPSRAPIRSSEISGVVALLRRPATARQAIIASIVLQPPRALETDAPR